MINGRTIFQLEIMPAMNDIPTIKMNTGDVAWLLTSTFLMALMVIGLSIYYAGMIPKKQNLMTILMQCYCVSCLLSIVWMCFGYSLAFSEGSPVIGDAKKFWLISLFGPSENPLAPNIPEILFCVYQLFFAIITTCIVLGGSSDRMKLFPMLIFAIIWHLIVYCPIAHWNWSPNGFLKKLGILDFAGGNVVHVAGGVAGLASSWVMGKRYGFGHRKFIPHEFTYIFLGANFLWIGWFGFNGGSAFSANEIAAAAVFNTQIASSSAAMGCLATEYLLTRRISAVNIINASIAGLVALTPAAGYVDNTGSFFIGLLSGILSYFCAQCRQMQVSESSYLRWIRYDDSMESFTLHGISGMLGGLLTGLFASRVGPESVSGLGAFYGGDGSQIALQLLGIAVTGTWSFVMTTVILLGMDLLLGGIRVTENAERRGLDLHGGGGLFVEPSSEALEEMSFRRMVRLLRKYSEAINVPPPAFMSEDIESRGGGLTHLFDEMCDDHADADLSLSGVKDPLSLSLDSSSSQSTISHAGINHRSDNKRSSSSSSSSDSLTRRILNTTINQQQQQPSSFIEETEEEEVEEKKQEDFPVQEFPIVPFSSLKHTNLKNKIQKTKKKKVLTFSDSVEIKEIELSPVLSLISHSPKSMNSDPTTISSSLSTKATFSSDSSSDSIIENEYINIKIQEKDQETMLEIDSEFSDSEESKRSPPPFSFSSHLHELSDMTGREEEESREDEEKDPSLSLADRFHLSRI